MACYVALVVIALSSMTLHILGHPLSEAYPLIDGSIAVDVFGTAQDTDMRRERSTGSSQQYLPAPPLPLYLPSVTGYNVASSYGVRINPQVVIHTCWKSRSSVLDIYRAIKNAILDSGLDLPSMKEALSVTLAVVTIKENYNQRSRYTDGYSSSGYYRTNSIISYRNIKEITELTIIQSSSLTHLAWLWSTAMWKNVKANVQRALCLTIALELVLRDLDKSTINIVGPNTKKEPQTATVYQKAQDHPGYKSVAVPAVTAVSPSTTSPSSVSAPTAKEPKPLQLGVDLIVPPISGSDSSAAPTNEEEIFREDLFQGDILGGMGLERNEATGQLTFAKGEVAGSAPLLDGIKESAKWSFWPEGKVFYEFAPGVRSEHQTLIMQAMDGISQVTCITFQQRPESRDKNFVTIRSDVNTACSSNAGMRVEGTQEMFLYFPTVDDGKSHCMVKGTIQHELIHLLGFLHEQSRNDRDNFIKINLDNLVDPEKMRVAFDKQPNTVNFWTPYDIRSIMHYRVNAFAKPGTRTIEPIGIYAGIDPKEVGQRERLGQEDINMINRAYGCDKVSFFATISNDGWRVQHGCDWVPNDIEGVPSSIEDCSQKCKDRTECTHFTWLGGGICVLKRGCPSFPFKRPGLDILCGYMPDRVTAKAGCTKKLES